MTAPKVRKYDPKFENRHTPKVRINALMQAKILRLLYTGLHSLAEILQESGCSDTTTRSYIGALRRERLVRIGAYAKARNGAMVVRLYEWAPDKADTKPPKPVNDALRSRASRKRHKQKATDKTLTQIVGTSAGSWTNMVSSLQYTPATKAK